MNSFWPLAVLAIVSTATVGAAISKHINEGTLAWYWAIAGSVLSGLAWGWIARQKNVSLVYASVLYDVLYALTYVGFLALAGEKITVNQAVGIGLSILGIAVAGWH